MQFTYHAPTADGRPPTFVHDLSGGHVHDHAPPPPRPASSQRNNRNRNRKRGAPGGAGDAQAQAPVGQNPRPPVQPQQPPQPVPPQQQQQQVEGGGKNRGTRGGRGHKKGRGPPEQHTQSAHQGVQPIKLEPVYQQPVYQQPHAFHQPAVTQQAPVFQQPAFQQHAPAPSTAWSHQSTTSFASLPISSVTKRAIAEVFRYEFCTHVQAQSLPACLAGGDVLAKAKTGTGKTIGFLIPVIERLLHNPPHNGQLGALILSPTRELASQIYNEALKLLTFHNLHADIVIGGTNQNSEMQRLRRKPPQILVATPGRCLDHLTCDSPLNGMMRELRVLVCDEADNLLDMGFRPTIVKILQCLPPKQQRQSLLFSATFPGGVKELANFALKTPWAEIDTVGEDTQTNAQVDQFQAVVPFDQQFSSLFAALSRHMQEEPNDYKIIAFFPTARQTQLYAETFNQAGMQVFEMHSRKSQSQRTKTSDQFRAAQKGIMFSSDVSARGVDYPLVTLVAQVGVPSDESQYVHRVGRTARAGKRGQALLMLCDFESGFLNKLKHLPLQPMTPIPPQVQQQANQAIASALPRVPLPTKEMAYVAWLGFYKSCPSCKFGSIGQLIEAANRLAYLVGCTQLPMIDTQTIGKMGLKGVPGLNVGKLDKGGRGGGRGGGGGGRGRGRG